MRVNLLALFLFMYVGVTSVFSQEEEEHTKQKMAFISGSFSYQSSTNANEELTIFLEDAKIKTFSVLPKLGLFINTNTAIGAGVGYTYEKLEASDYDGELTSTTPLFSIEPFMRSYRPLTDDASIFVDASAFYRFGTQTFDYYDEYDEDNYSEKTEKTSYGVAISPGITYHLTENIAMELVVGKLHYTKSKSKPKGAPDDFTFKSSSYGLKLDLDHATLGVVIYLTR